MNELLAHGMCEDRTGPQHSFQAASETTGVWNSSDVDERNIRINADSVRKKTTFTRQWKSNGAHSALEHSVETLKRLYELLERNENVQWNGQRVEKKQSRYTKVRKGKHTILINWPQISVDAAEWLKLIEHILSCMCFKTSSADRKKNRDSDEKKSDTKTRMETVVGSIHYLARLVLSTASLWDLLISTKTISGCKRTHNHARHINLGSA